MVPVQERSLSHTNLEQMERIEVLRNKRDRGLLLDAQYEELDLHNKFLADEHNFHWEEQG